MSNQWKNHRIHNIYPTSRGFTLVELLIAMAITSIVVAILYTTFQNQQQIHNTQNQVVEMQQNIRSAMAIMSREIMLAGYDPEDSGLFGFTDITQNTVTFSMDVNSNGHLDGGESITYSLFDSPVADVSERDGILDIGRDTGSGAELVAESVSAMSFAYAFDDDGDGALDTTLNGQTIWAIDTDGDGLLDTTLDTSSPGIPGTPDGLITEVDIEGGGSLGYTVPMSSIRVVKIWILARTQEPQSDFIDTKLYVVGDKHLKITDEGRHRLLTSTIFCRNT